MAMNLFKALLIVVRWGDQLSDQDIHLANEMTFMEVFRSSYLTPKTVRVAFDRQLKRR